MAIEFQSYEVNNINYDDLTASIDYYLDITFPKIRSDKKYSNWIDSFIVNDTIAAGKVGGVYISTNDSVLYRFTYTAQSTDSELKLSCKIKDDLEIVLDPQVGFWELNGVSKNDAIIYNQDKLDQEGGYLFADFTDENQAHDFNIDQKYRITGKITAIGSDEFLLREPHENENRIRMEYNVNVLSDAFENVVCYFINDQEWLDRPKLSIGDTITLYGQYAGDWWGPYFEGCTFNSPAGRFAIMEDGSASVIPETPYELVSDLDITGIEICFFGSTVTEFTGKIGSAPIDLDANMYTFDGDTVSCPLKWYSSDETVCTVDGLSGEVTFVGSGECDIVAQYQNISAKCHVWIP